MKSDPKVIGGIGEKKSNGGTQYYEQNRIYDGNEVATCIAAESSFHPYYSIGGGSRMEGISKEVEQLLIKAIELGYVELDFKNGKIEKDNSVPSDLRIRKLTPCECLKLMGFERKDYLALKKVGMSDLQIYKMAGDSIVVPVIVSLFSPLFNEHEEHREIIERYADDLAKGESYEDNI